MPRLPAASKGALAALLGASMAASACGHAGSAPRDRLLDQAIQSIATPSASCAPSDYSTEDARILGELTSQRYSVEDVVAEKDEDGPFTTYWLSVGERSDIVRVSVRAEGGDCAEYTIARVLQ